MSRSIISNACERTSPVKRHRLTLADVTPAARDAVTVTFAVPPELRDDFHHKPGQYAALRAAVDVRDDVIQRTYTIVSEPGAAHLQFIVRQIPSGTFSNFLAGCKAGDIIELSTPMGRFCLPPPDDKPAAKHYLLLASGIGITPIFAIARGILAQDALSRVTLITGNRDTERMVLREALCDLKDEHTQRLHLIHLLSRQTQDVELLNSRLDAGALQRLFEAGLILPKTEGKQNYRAYLCLPEALSDEIIEWLQAQGISREHIKREQFVTQKILDQTAAADNDISPKAVTAEVTLVLDGISHQFVIADKGENILQAARNHDVTVPSSCRAGMCATCRCKLTEGTVAMKQNYSLEDWELEAGYVLACQSVPTSTKIALDFDAV